MKKLLALFGVLLFIGAGCTYGTDDADQVGDDDVNDGNIIQELVEDDDSDDDDNAATDTSSTDEAAVEFTLEAPLADVSGGVAKGTAMAGFREGSGYQMEAIFEGLPELEEGFFYEGWIVRGAAESVISTGATTDEGNRAHSNLFSSDEDRSDHLKYVLTLEPDDGDPAPAEHILEGTFTQK